MQVFALAASIAMAVGMNSVFAYATVSNPDRRINSLAITIDGGTVRELTLLA